MKIDKNNISTVSQMLILADFVEKDISNKTGKSYTKNKMIVNVYDTGTINDSIKTKIVNLVDKC